jgi:hypothetical protein
MIVDFDAELSGVHQLPPGTPQSAGGLLCSHLKHVMENDLASGKSFRRRTPSLSARSAESFPAKHQR